MHPLSSMFDVTLKQNEDFKVPAPVELPADVHPLPPDITEYVRQLSLSLSVSLTLGGLSLSECSLCTLSHWNTMSCIHTRRTNHTKRRSSTSSRSGTLPK